MSNATSGWNNETNNLQELILIEALNFENAIEM